MPLGRSLFKKKDTKPDAHAWIGLDFGTATTECVIRIESAGVPDRVAVLAFDGRTRRDARVVLPSAMEVLDGSIFPADSLLGRGRIVETLKTKLIAEVDSATEHAVLRRPDGPYAWILLHLASVLGVARSAITKSMGKRRVGYYLNIATPVGADPANPRDARLREVFREAAYRALALSAEWPVRRVTEAEAGELFRQGMAFDVPGVGDSPVVSVPEALAAVASFLNAPGRRAGNYATIDVGGGTTDTSFFWYSTGEHDAAHERKAWYYSARTDPVGTNDLIAGLRGPLVEPKGLTSHEHLWNLDDHVNRVRPRDLSAFIGGLNGSYRESFREAFSLRPVFSDWCREFRARWTLLLLGGGCGFPFVQTHLSATPPLNLNITGHGGVETLSAPGHLDIILPDGTVLPPVEPDYWRPAEDVVRSTGHLLTVAHGLAFRTPDIPKFGLESRVDSPAAPPDWQPPPHTEHN